MLLNISIFKVCNNIMDEISPRNILIGQNKEKTLILYDPDLPSIALDLFCCLLFMMDAFPSFVLFKMLSLLSTEFIV